MHICKSVDRIDFELRGTIIGTEGTVGLYNDCRLQIMTSMKPIISRSLQ